VSGLWSRCQGCGRNWCENPGTPGCIYFPWRDARDMALSDWQRQIGRMPVTLRTRRDYLRCARWWEIEAMRGYPSSDMSRQYAINMRWCADAVRDLNGGEPATWPELRELAVR
jgi:hypothetical protein